MCMRQVQHISLVHCLHEPESAGGGEVSSRARGMRRVLPPYFPIHADSGQG